VSDQEAKSSDLVEIAKRNGEFRKNYGVVIGAFLYLRSINAARNGSFLWRGMIAALAAAVALWEKSGWSF
jgi:hypothetical protein